MIPIINDEVQSHGWMTMDEVLDIVEKSTEELLHELQKAEDVFEFTRENEEEMDENEKAEKSANIFESIAEASKRSPVIISEEKFEEVCDSDELCLCLKFFDCSTTTVTHTSFKTTHKLIDCI